MNFPFYIAQRYLLAKKSHNLINIISWISVVGVAVGAFALIVVLSVFNGFELVIGQLVQRTTPDLLVEPRQGKWINRNQTMLSELADMQGVAHLVEVVEEDALFRFGDKQHIGRLKAVGSNYSETGILDSLLVEGSAQTESGQVFQAVAGAGVAWSLGLQSTTRLPVIQVYVPGNEAAASLAADPGFEVASIAVGGVFASQQDVDAQLVFVPLRFAQQLLALDNQVSYLEIYVRSDKDLKTVQKDAQALLGASFTVKDQIQQQETLYNIMKSEKGAIFIILTFILFMATFNVVGSLAMLIVDKQRDTEILKQLGASSKRIRDIFFIEGLLISLAGGMAGLLVGTFVVWLQETFGLIQLGNESGAFVINAYPVDFRFLDFLLVFLTVFVIGSVSSWLTVNRLVRKMALPDAD